MLKEEPEDPEDKLSRMRKIRIQADLAEEYLESCNLSDLGLLIGEAWEEKRGISSSVTRDEIDLLHQEIMSVGASGAKLLGAGGGGFFLVHGTVSLRKDLNLLKRANKLIPVGLDNKGSTIIYEG